MTEDMSGKEQGSGKKITERSKPTLVEVGKKKVVSTGAWNTDVIADWIIEKGSKRWVKIGEIDGLINHRQSPRGKKNVRRHLPTLFWAVFKRQLLLAIEYNGDYGAASAVKVLDSFRSHEEKEAIDLRLEKMKTRNELTSGQYNAVKQFVDTHMSTAPQNPPAQGSGGPTDVVVM